MASSSTKDLTKRSNLTCFLMLGGEIMEAMTWTSTSTYNGNMKFLDGLNCKSFIEIKQDPWEQATEAFCKNIKGDN
jgi:hypothetical protein